MIELPKTSSGFQISVLNVAFTPLSLSWSGVLNLATETDGALVRLKNDTAAS
jgi:hypothetical protein